MAGKDVILSRTRSTQPWRSCRTGEYRLGGLVTVYKTPTAAAALELIAAVGRLAEDQNHHPDLDWRYNRVFLRYTSHDAGGKVTPGMWRRPLRQVPPRPPPGDRQIPRRSQTDPACQSRSCNSELERRGQAQGVVLRPGPPKVQGCADGGRRAQDHRQHPRNPGQARLVAQARPP